ncbi:MAG: hypothetical protein HRU38_18920 [Saccharospirillaceae bacterium]|nr:hypothetical protein [Saccharospirillaceae bacterium]
MKWKLYKYLVSFMWIIFSMIVVSIGLQIYLNDKLTFSNSSQNIEVNIVIGCIIAAVIGSLVGLAVIFQKKISLIIIVPLSMFLCVYLYDQLTGDYIFYKYVYLGIILLVVHLATIHIVTKRKSPDQQNV